MNGFILIILALQLSLSLICAILSFIFEEINQSGMWYIEENTPAGYNATLRYFTYFILFNTMIPISLIVSLEIVKIIQAYFIMRDEEMYIAAKDKWPTV